MELLKENGFVGPAEARLFPNETPCLRLATAVVLEIAEGWQTVEQRDVVFDG